MEPGDEFVASRNLYGGSLTQFGLSFKKLGWTCHFVDPTDPENFRRALTPTLQGDLHREPRQSRRRRRRHRGASRAVAHEAGLPLIVDNTLATPYLCRPIEQGRRHRRPFDHQVPVGPRQFARRRRGRVRASSTGRKGGRFPSLTEPEPAYHGLKFFENFGDFAFTTKARAVALRDFGPALAPMNAFLTITGIETLHVRMERHVANAQKVAEFLAAHPKVAWVSYAGLPASPYSELAQKYLPQGRGRGVHLRRQGRLRGRHQAGRDASGCSRISPISATPAA